MDRKKLDELKEYLNNTEDYCDAISFDMLLNKLRDRLHGCSVIDDIKVNYSSKLRLTDEFISSFIDTIVDDAIIDVFIETKNDASKELVNNYNFQKNKNFKNVEDKKHDKTTYVEALKLYDYLFGESHMQFYSTAIALEYKKYTRRKIKKALYKADMIFTFYLLNEFYMHTLNAGGDDEFIDFLKNKYPKPFSDPFTLKDALHTFENDYVGCREIISNIAFKFFDIITDVIFTWSKDNNIKWKKTFSESDMYYIFFYLSEFIYTSKVCIDCYDSLDYIEKNYDPYITEMLKKYDCDNLPVEKVISNAKRIKVLENELYDMNREVYINDRHESRKSLKILEKIRDAMDYTSIVDVLLTSAKENKSQYTDREYRGLRACINQMRSYIPYDIEESDNEEQLISPEELRNLFIDFCNRSKKFVNAYKHNDFFALSELAVPLYQQAAYILRNLDHIIPDKDFQANKLQSAVCNILNGKLSDDVIMIDVIHDYMFASLLTAFDNVSLMVYYNADCNVYSSLCVYKILILLFSNIRLSNARQFESNVYYDISNMGNNDNIKFICEAIEKCADMVKAQISNYLDHQYISALKKTDILFSYMKSNYTVVNFYYELSEPYFQGDL